MTTTGWAEANPSKDELLERCRQKVLHQHCLASQRVLEQLRALLEAKFTGEDEVGEDEEYALLTPEDLTSAIKHIESRNIDTGHEKDCWSITILSVDRIGDPLKIYVQLPRQADGYLRITEFELCKS